MLIQLFAKNLFEEVEDPAPIGSKLSKQEVQLTRTLPFKMYIRLQWMHAMRKM